jgi:aspartyl-tRNA(Asn)/glutamyl-tRNA(Gln) amidotransferase subunit B
MLKDLYDLSFERIKDFPSVYEEEGRPVQSRDTPAIETIINEIIAANPKQLEQYRAGKKTLASFFVGQVMKASKGQANPQLVNDLVTKKLESQKFQSIPSPGPRGLTLRSHANQR